MVSHARNIRLLTFSFRYGRQILWPKVCEQHLPHGSTLTLPAARCGEVLHQHETDQRLEIAMTTPTSSTLVLARAIALVARLETAPTDPCETERTTDGTLSAEMIVETTGETIEEEKR